MPALRSDTLADRLVDGRYRIVSHLADGGMGSVYVALDERLDREVALKILRPDLSADPDFVARFRREARSAARLSHPHVVAVYDQGEDDDLVFLAMELVDGMTLREVLHTEAPLSPRAALDVMEPVLQALGAAHKAGIVHRDVKPENVILREDGVVKVADFGLARAVTSATATSHTGVLMGTVAYLAPEQVAEGRADARTDVYAAGLVLFEMLTGERAFQGDTAIHVAYQHVYGEAPAPSSKVDALAPALDALVALGAAREPDDRPADATAYLAEVRKVRGSLTPTELDLRPGRTMTPSGPSATMRMPAPGGAPSSRTHTGAGATAVLTAPGASTALAARPSTTSVLTTGPAGDKPGNKPAKPRRTSGKGRRWAWVALALALLLVGGGATWALTAGPFGMTEVPKVTGQTEQAAAAALTADDLRVDTTDVFSETVAKGVVISSDPGTGAELRKGGTVTLTVSKGPERYAVPAVAGKTLAEAKDQLAEQNLVVGKTAEAFDEKVPAGIIVSASPKAGTPAKKGSAVTLVISKGRQPITLDSWEGKSAADAQKALAALGLEVDATQQQNSDTVKKGDVISQTPVGGTLYKGDKVTLVVSKGPTLVQVPNVIGKQRGEATNLLRSAGFEVRYSAFMGGLFGTVRSQSLEGGSMQPKGSTITLVIV